MITIGSYDNPYPEFEFHNLNNNGVGKGGWVQSSYSLSYYSRDLTRYFGDMKKSCPVSYTIYQEMFSNGYWNGGWVGSYSCPNYYTRFGIEYEGSTGYQQSPWPFDVYDEMAHNGMWNSGWVEFSDGSVQYVPELDMVEGCGSTGTGSGSFSFGDSGNEGGSDGNLGCAITSGSGIVGTLKNGAFRLEAEWTSGNTFGSNGLANLTIDLVVVDSSYNLVDSYFTASWSDPYVARIEGDFSYEEGSVIRHCYILNGSITIPEEYRVDSDQ